MQSLRVILAVAKKDLSTLFRYPTWFISVIIWPLIFPLLYILTSFAYAGPDRKGLIVFQKVAGTENIMGYIVIGTMVWMAVNITMWNYGGYLREEQLRGTLESNWLCPVNKFSILLGAGIISMVLSIMFSVIGIIEYRLIYGIKFTGNLIDWIVVFLILFPGVYGLGMIFASLILWAKEVNAAVNVARGIMMILCGITYPIYIMPNWMQALAKFLPFTFGIQAARDILIMDKTLLETAYNLILCSGEGIIFLALGMLIFKLVEKRVKISGSLERF